MWKDASNYYIDLQPRRLNIEYAGQCLGRLVCEIGSTKRDKEPRYSSVSQAVHSTLLVELVPQQRKCRTKE